MTANWTWKIALLVLAGTAAAPALGRADCRAASPDYTLGLFELYTSEGCDSCPPADRWFSTLDLGPAASRAAALAFHVDYWDRLGWRDRFGSADYTERQHDQMWRHNKAFVFTPQVLLQGRDISSWRGADQPVPNLEAINGRPARATIELAATPVDPAKIAVDVHVVVPSASDREHAVVAVALAQSGLSSNVKAGENKGKHLDHDHVVRAWRAGLAVGATGELRQRLNLPLPAEPGPRQIVAFVENSTNGDVLQALTLDLCDN